MENENNRIEPTEDNAASSEREVPFDGNLASGQEAAPMGQNDYGATPYGGPAFGVQGQNPGPQNPNGAQQYPSMQQGQQPYQPMPLNQQDAIQQPQPVPMQPNGPDVQAAPDTASSADQSQQQEQQASQKQEGRHAAHAKKAQSAFIQRSSRMRKLYVAIIILLVIIVVAIAFLAVRMIWTADNSATQQTQVTSTDIEQASDASDTEESDSPKTTVPNIVELLGHTRKEALEMIGHGAEVVSNRSIKEENNPIKRELRIELTDEPSDSKSGAPTVYLSLNKDKKVIHAGYSVSTSSLGYGSASFSDTIESEHIVENTLGEAGLSVELGSAVLPEDVTEYTSYSSDGTTVTKEYYSFSGTGTAGGKTYDWEAILSYDYTVANASDNLNDTLRTIFVYVS